MAQEKREEEEKRKIKGGLRWRGGDALGRDATFA